MLVCSILGLYAWAPAGAEPLTFGAINGTADLSGNTEVAYCPKTRSRDAPRTCALARTSFGGLPVSKGLMTLNPAGRVRSLTILLDGKDHDRATEMLAGRYGPPTNGGNVARWTGFDEGARIAVGKGSSGTVISFDFPANEAVASASAPGARLVWALLFFAAAGIAAVLVLLRARAARQARARARRAMPTSSLRETLERKIREGVDLQF